MAKGPRKVVENRPMRGLNPNMPITRLLSRSRLEIGLVYLAGYVLLDWVSFIHPVESLAITPWNPHPGLSVALILLFGRGFLPWLFAAPLIADALVRQLPLPLWAELVAALIISAGYGIGASILLSPRIHFDITFKTKRDLFWLTAVAALASAAVAVSYVALVVAIGLVDPSQFARAALRYWIGDMIGIIVVAPFVLVLLTGRRVALLSWEFGAALALLLLALWLVVGVEAFQFQLFYLLFLPVIWTAVRFGLEGVTIGLAVTQIGLVAAIHLSGHNAIDVTAFQALMIVLALTGLGVGVLVSEQQRTQHQLRMHQDALARVTRLGSMGELAAAIAHEINQPLTAIANYARLAKEAAQSPSANLTTIAEAATKASDQVDRAAEVVRRLRDFVRLGRSDIAVISLSQVFHQAKAIIGSHLDQHGILLEIQVAPDVPPAMADSLQIQQVVLNLVRNAAEAIVEAGRYDGRIAIAAQMDTPEFIRVCVRDNGPGFDSTLIEPTVAPFTTTKPDGMGLGLSLSRSIIEAHQGKFFIGGDSTGAIVCFTLPSAGTKSGDAVT